MNIICRPENSRPLILAIKVSNNFATSLKIENDTFIFCFEDKNRNCEIVNKIPKKKENRFSSNRFPIEIVTDLCRCHQDKNFKDWRKKRHWQKKSINFIFLRFRLATTLVLYFVSSVSSIEYRIPTWNLRKFFRSPADKCENKYKWFLKQLNLVENWN